MHVQYTVWHAEHMCGVFSAVLGSVPQLLSRHSPQVRDHVNSIEDVQAAPTQVALRSSTPPVLIPITWYYAQANLSKPRPRHAHVTGSRNANYHSYFQYPTYPTGA
eukprot:scaffold17877_cov66-Phaeocystis_antarctica.AAC.11